MLEGGFLAKVSDFKPRPSLLYLEAKISGRDLSCLIDIEATQSFMSSKLAKELDLRVQKASKSINVHFAKGEPHKTQEVALDVTLECEKLEIKETFTFCKMDEVDLILSDTFFEAHIADVRQKLVWLEVCRNGKEVTLKLGRSSMAMESKLNLVFLE
jgi:hypothetical protein